MKTYFLFAYFLFNCGWAYATTQVTLNQDKPSMLYVNSYKEGLTASFLQSTIVDNPPWYSGVWSTDHDFQAIGESRSYTYNMNATGAYQFYHLVNSTWPWAEGIAGTEVAFHGIDTDMQVFTSSGSNLQANIYYPPGPIWIYNRQQYSEADWTFSGGVPITIEITTNLSSGNTYYGNPYGPPISQEYCDINNPWPDHSGFSSAWGTTFIATETYHRNAQVTVKLKTGGKAASRLRNLFGISGYAIQCNPPTPGMASGSPSYGPWQSPYVTYGQSFQVPSASVALGSYGNLGTNAVKYLILPDNADVDITPYVAGSDYYTFNLNQPQKYKSYFDLYVQQANPGYSFYPVGDVLDDGHAFWRFRTDAPADALQYISTNLTHFLGIPWGFYPVSDPPPSPSNLYTVQGFLNNDGPPTAHSYNICRTFHIGFPNLLEGLIFTRGIYNAPPIWCGSGYNCIGAARNAGFEADIFGLPSDTTPQNFGVMLIEMYPAPGLNVGPFEDTTDIFYSTAPY